MISRSVRLALAPVLLAAGCISPPPPMPEPVAPEPVPEPEPEPTAEELEAAKVAECEEGKVSTCVEVAESAKDPAVVLRAYEKSCELELATGCRRYADLYIKTKGHELTRYMEVVGKACAGNHAASCGEVAKEKIEGWIDPPDMDAALAAGKVACDLQDETGCRIVSVVEQYQQQPKPKKALPEQFGNLTASSMIAIGLECKGTEASFKGAVQGGVAPKPGAVHLAALSNKKKEIDACGGTWDLAPVQWKVRRNRISKVTGDGAVGECVAKVIETVPYGAPVAITEEADRKKIESKLNWECRATLVIGY